MSNESRPRMPHDDGLSIPMFGVDDLILQEQEVIEVEVQEVQEEEVQQDDEEQTTNDEIQSP